MEGLDIIWYGSWWACRNWVLSAKTVKSLHFTQHYASSLSKGISPIPTFLCNNLKVKGQKDQTCTRSHFQIFVEVEFFSDINFSISMIYCFNSLALLQKRNAPTDKLLRHNVMLYVQRYHAVADKWVLRRSGWSNIIFSLPGMYAKWHSHQIWMIPCSSRIDSNIIILIRFDRSCVSIGPCFD